jgi:hypothetical protein
LSQIIGFIKITNKPKSGIENPFVVTPYQVGKSPGIAIEYLGDNLEVFGV